MITILVVRYICQRENLRESIADVSRINMVESGTNLSHGSNLLGKNSVFGLVSTIVGKRRRLYVT